MSLFEVLAEVFFSEPDQSVRGWETPIAAQARIRRAVSSILKRSKNSGDVAIVAHGAVGALLLCDFMGRFGHQPPF